MDLRNFAALLLALLLADALAAQGFCLDYRPTQPEVVLDTDDTMIRPTNGVPVRVQGGIFVFRSVTIPAGVTVRGVGLKSRFSGLEIADKYPIAPNWNWLPAGGFGGLGVIQLITPPVANMDGTNTILDAGIDLQRAGTLLRS